MLTIAIRGVRLCKRISSIVTENGIAYPPFGVILRKVVSGQ